MSNFSTPQNRQALEVIFLIGLQGAGKSTFYQTHFAQTHLHLSMDLLPGVRNRRRRLESMLVEALQECRSVVLDNTNPSMADRATFLQIARTHNATTIGYYLESRMADCLERNSRRIGAARVPDMALFTTRNKLELPTCIEGFDQLFFVQIANRPGCDPSFNVMEWREEEDNLE